MKALLVGLMLLALPAWAAPVPQLPVPKQFTARYAMFRNGQNVGEVSEKFTHDGKTYVIESETKAAGVFSFFAKGTIRMVSRGEISRTGLKPVRFEHWRGADAARMIAADFDWQAGSVTLSYDGKRETAPLTAGTQDRLSQMYQFMFVAMPVTQLVFDSTNGRMVENYRYALIGKEPTKTSLGNIPALRFTKDQVAGQDKTDIWLAVSRKNFPVRIQQADKEGGKLEQVLTALSL